MFILPLLFSYKVIPTYNAFFIFLKLSHLTYIKEKKVDNNHSKHITLYYSYSYKNLSIYS